MLRMSALRTLGAAVLASPLTLAYSGTESPRFVVPVVVSTPAEGASLLTLDAAQARAVQANPELAAARRELDAVEAARLQAAARPNPSLDVQVEDIRRDSRTTTIAIGQTLELGGKREARIEAAERAIEIARSQLDARIAEIHASVTSAFFAALIAQDRVDLAQASVDVAARGRDAAAKRVLAGKVSPVEETRAKVAEAGVRMELVQARAELQSALQRFWAAMGSVRPLGRPDGDALDLPRIATPESIARRVEAAPALREARLTVRRQAALVNLEAARRTPDLTFTVGVKRDAELGRNMALLGISLPLPLFDTNRGNLLEALRRRDRAEDLLRVTELRLRTEAGIAAQTYSASVAEVMSLKDEVLPGAQSAFEAAAKGFELGKFGYLDVLDAQRTLQQARAQYLRALAEAHRAAAEIDRLLGGSENGRLNLPETLK